VNGKFSFSFFLDETGSDILIKAALENKDSLKFLFSFP